MERKGTWMLTATGKAFWPLDPRPEELCIYDIARSLSLQCRFAGHLSEFYSVAQHSIYVSQVCSPQNRMWGLLHDASEAYCQDLIRPVKAHLDSYKAIEERIQRCIAERFNLCWPMPDEIKAVDNIVLWAELTQLRPAPPSGYSYVEPALEIPEWLKIQPWHSHVAAESAFLLAAEEMGVA